MFLNGQNKAFSIMNQSGNVQFWYFLKITGHVERKFDKQHLKSRNILKSCSRKSEKTAEFLFYMKVLDFDAVVDSLRS